MSSAKTVITLGTIHFHLKVGSGSTSAAGAIRNKAAGRGFVSIGQTGSFTGHRPTILSDLFAKRVLLPRLGHEEPNDST
jgi:hypothetical protein